MHDPRVYVDLPQLLALEPYGRKLALSQRRASRSSRSGTQGSRLRGRGLDFHELRSYQVGDDVRDIDWQASARTRFPQVKTYCEERDRSTLLVVDQRVSMFFGTSHATKSVIAAEAAALFAWNAMANGDRVGALLFDDRQCAEYRAQRSRAQQLRVLAGLVEVNQGLRADLPPGDSEVFNRVLDSAAQLARHDHRIVVISDFDGSDHHSREQLAGLARHNELICLLVHDPSDLDSLFPQGLVATNGASQAHLNFCDKQMRTELHAHSVARNERVLGWGVEFGFPALPLSSAEDARLQLYRLFSKGAR